MRGTRVILDEEKIKREGKYNLDKMYYALAEYAKRNNLIVKDKNTFICPGTQHDLAYLGNYVYKYLARQLDWFPENVKEWTWFCEEDNYVEDMIKLCKKHKVGLYAR